MKKLILSFVAATLIAGPLATTTAAGAAPQRPDYGDQRRDHGEARDYRDGRDDVRSPRDVRPQYRSWRKGQRFDQRYAQHYRQIDYRQYRGLRAPPRGYRYVQSGNDAVLVGITSGLIAAVVAGAIR